LLFPYSTTTQNTAISVIGAGMTEKSSFLELSLKTPHLLARTFFGEISQDGPQNRPNLGLQKVRRRICRGIRLNKSDNIEKTLKTRDHA